MSQPPWGAPPPPPPPPPGWGPPSYPPPGYGGFTPPPPPPRGNRGLWVGLAAVVAVLVLGLAVLVPVLVLSGDDDASEEASDDRDPRTSEPASSGTETESETPEPEADLSAVEEYDGLPSTHVDAPVDYPQVPPVGGEHFGEWLDCGVYDVQVPDENAVHDLEHGTVWITYEPLLPDDDVAVLEGLLPQNGILSPYDGMDAPVVVTVWGRQLKLAGVDDPRLPLFIEEYQGGVTAPEPFASCAGGTADPNGGAAPA